MGLSVEDLFALVEYDHRSTRWGLELTLDELATGGRLEPVDAAQVAALRVMASTLDLDVENAALWREYNERLRATVEGRPSDDGLTDALERFNLSTAVQDPSTT